MKVKVRKGSSNEVMDTEKMGDKEAEILEAVQKLYAICERYKVPAVCKIIQQGQKCVGFSFLPNSQSKAETLVGAVDEWLKEISDGALEIVEKD